MKLKKNLALSDSGFVFDPSTGDSFSTNPIGLEIVKMLQTGKNADQIKEQIVKTYLIDESGFEKDYYDFVKTLTKLRLSDGNPEKKD